jgi:hypothetical protein
LIEHVLIRHHWVLEFLKTRNSKFDYRRHQSLVRTEDAATDFQTTVWLQYLQGPWTPQQKFSNKP